MNDVRTQNSTLAFHTRVLALGCILALIGLTVLSWGPFFGTLFGPIDDHELVAYLSHRGRNGVSSIWTGVYEFSPMHRVPNSTHWRPGIWIVRIIEVEIFGSNSLGYAIVRLTSLLASGFMLTSALALLLSRVSVGKGNATLRHLISGLFLLVFLSSPLWTDVFGRHLAAERHLILGIAFTTLGFAISGSGRSSVGGRIGPTLILVGLTALVMSKENATYLVPAFGLLALASKDQLWRLLGRLQTFWLVFVILPLWITCSITVFRSTFRGTSVKVPYAGEIDLLRLPLFLLELPLNGYFCALSASLLVIILSPRLRHNSFLVRMVIFFGMIVALEHVFTRVVGVAAPRYMGVSFTLTLLGVAMTTLGLVESRAGFAGQTLIAFITCSAAVCSVTGFTAVNQYLSWQRGHSQDWNHEIEDLAESARRVNAEAVLIIVDPPPKEISGRVEKTYSMIKFLDWHLDKSVDFEIALLEMPNTQRYDIPSFQHLATVAAEGTTLNGGVDIRAFDSSKHSRRFCVLYSTSGRGSPHLDNCLGVRRFTL